MINGNIIKEGYGKKIIYEVDDVWIHKKFMWLDTKKPSKWNQWLY